MTKRQMLVELDTLAAKAAEAMVTGEIVQPAGPDANVLDLLELYEQGTRSELDPYVQRAFRLVSQVMVPDFYTGVLFMSLVSAHVAGWRQVNG